MGCCVPARGAWGEAAGDRAMMPVVWTLERARGGPLGLAGGLVAVCGVLARCRYDARLGARARRLADLLIVATLVVVAGVTALDAVSNIRWPRPWDNR